MEYAQYVAQASTEVREQMALENATDNEKAIGEFLLVQFDDEDMKLAVPFCEKKIRLSEVWGKIHAKAKNYLKSKDGAIRDEIVYGWACNIILGNEGDKKAKVKIASDKPKRIVNPKPKPKPVEEGERYVQGSLFDA